MSGNNASTGQPLRRTAGEMLRDWRHSRGQTQFELASQAQVSTRHLSCLESDKAEPSRVMLMRLARHLELSLRDTNLLLMAGGFAPMFPERPWEDPSLAAARDVVDSVLRASEPSPAFTVDRHWNMIARNRMTEVLLGQVAPRLLQAPLNVFRLALDPEGLAPQILNLSQWRSYIFTRLARQIGLTADPVLIRLLHELQGLAGHLDTDDEPSGHSALVMPLRLATPWGPLTLINTVTMFGTPLEVSLSELTLEVLYPADTATRSALETIWRAQSDQAHIQ